MKATSTNGFGLPPIGSSVRGQLFDSGTKISAQSPFGDMLHISTEVQNQIQGTCKLRLISINGKTVLEQQIQTPFEELSISAGQIPPGIYLLRFETEREVQTFKVVKCE